MSYWGHRHNGQWKYPDLKVFIILRARIYSGVTLYKHTFFCAGILDITPLWMPFSNYFALKSIATLSALYFPVTVYVLSYILYCNVTKAVF